MQRRKALLQIENILILLMLGGRGGERQRERREKARGKRGRGGIKPGEAEGAVSCPLPAATCVDVWSLSYISKHICIFFIY